jgi:hypothetical protein
LAGPVAALRVLDPPHDTGRYATGIVVDTERRLLFVACSLGHLLIHDADSGLRRAVIDRTAEKWGNPCADVAVIDGVIVTADQSRHCLHFVAIDVIPGLN